MNMNAQPQPSARKLRLVSIYLKLCQKFRHAQTDDRRRQIEKRRGKTASLVHEA